MLSKLVNSYKTDITHKQRSGELDADYSTFYEYFVERKLQYYERTDRTKILYFHTIKE